MTVKLSEPCATAIHTRRTPVTSKEKGWVLGLPRVRKPESRTLELPPGNLRHVPVDQSATGPAGLGIILSRAHSCCTRCDVVLTFALLPR